MAKVHFDKSKIKRSRNKSKEDVARTATLHSKDLFILPMGHETEMRYTSNKALIEKVVSVWSLLLMLDYLAKFYLERDLWYQNVGYISQNIVLVFQYMFNHTLHLLMCSINITFFGIIILKYKMQPHQTASVISYVLPVGTHTTGTRQRN